jgi:ribonuclease P protein component
MRRFKLKEDIKLKDKTFINSIFKQGNKKPQRISVIFYLESSKFSFLISFKKKLLNPAKRNKFKRQIKEFIRLNQYNLKKIDCAILIVKIPSAKMQLFKELEFLLER